MAEFVALDGGGNLAERHVTGFAPVASVKGTVEIDQEMEERIVRPA